MVPASPLMLRAHQGQPSSRVASTADFSHSYRGLNVGSIFDANSQNSFTPCSSHVIACVGEGVSVYVTSVSRAAHAPCRTVGTTADGQIHPTRSCPYDSAQTAFVTFAALARHIRPPTARGASTGRTCARFWRSCPSDAKYTCIVQVRVSGGGGPTAEEARSLFEGEAHLYGQGLQ